GDLGYAGAVRSCAGGRLALGVPVNASAGIHCGAGKAGNVLRGMHRGAGFVNHASEINRGADFLRQLATTNDPQAMMEFFGDEFSGAGVSVEMRLFAGDFEMSAAEEIALDVFVADDLLDQVDGYKGVGVH